MPPEALLLLAALTDPMEPATVPPPRTTASTGGSGTTAPETIWELGVAWQRDRFDYRFENPSSFDTTALVPHHFEQTYDADNLWIAGRVRYGLGRRSMETEAGITPTTTGVGTDYDTFFNPNGNVIVYGTTATTDAWAWRAAQSIGLGAGVRVGYGYRRDRAEFRPSVTTTVQTMPPSSTSFLNDARETTISQVHEVRFGLDRHVAPASAWDIRLTADAAPVAVARLSTLLPDKYPDPIVFTAKGSAIEAAIHVARRSGRWRVGASIDYARAWSYQEASRYRRNALWVGGFVGRHPTASSDTR